MSAQNPAIDPRRTALLIMDYQPAILGGLGDHDHLLTLASGAIDLARQAGITVASTSSPTPAPTLTRTSTPSSPRKSCPCRGTSSPSPTSPA